MDKETYKNVVINQAKTKSRLGADPSTYKAENKKKDTLIVLGMLGISIVLLLVDTISFLIYPVQLFVVGLHELSHGFMAIILGGSVTGIHIDPLVGGYTQFMIEPSSLKHIMVASAGYLGSMIWGALIFLIAAKTQYDKVLSFCLGLLMLLLSFFVLMEWSWFGVVFSFAAAVFLFASAFFLSHRFNDLMLRFLGLSSCSYVVVDIFDDLIGRYNIGNDSDIIAGLLGLPAIASVIIGISWMVLAILVMVFTIKKALS